VNARVRRAVALLLWLPLAVACSLAGAGAAPENGPKQGRAGADITGAIYGKVLFGGLPLPDVVLRLVRDADSAFVPGVTARTDSQGSYRFTKVAAGRYRVYAYVGDNPDYFNRETTALRVGDADVVAPVITMGRVIRPVQPPPGARLPQAPRLSFQWTPCPGAARYEFTVIDPETHEEVAFAVVTAATAGIPGGALTLGRRYHCQVLALTGEGAVLGSTPGRGASPWSVTVVAHEGGAPE
jgi:hypothetical protein